MKQIWVLLFFSSKKNYYFKSGSIFVAASQSAFTLQDKNFGIISNNKSGCNYLSIVELGKNKILLEGECLPDDEDLDFNGSGGAYFFEGENLYITIGIPTATGEKTSLLAQDEKSIYGKILKINKRELLKNDNEKIQYEIFSMGHRNPQGLLKINDKIFSVSFLLKDSPSPYLVP